MTVRTFWLVLEDQLTAVRTACDLSCYLDAAGGACFCAIANLMTAFWTLYYHLLIYDLHIYYSVAESDFPQPVFP